jgi:hypothetical protein
MKGVNNEAEGSGGLDKRSKRKDNCQSGVNKKQVDPSWQQNTYHASTIGADPGQQCGRVSFSQAL